MPIYKVANDQIMPIQPTTFSQQRLRERQDLQSMLKTQIDIIAPDKLVVAEEFGEWEDSRRRIDLLGIDKAANLIVIELKRTEDGGHMELQAIRYASMISTLTFSKLVTIYERYLADNNIEADAAEKLLEFLDYGIFVVVPHPCQCFFGRRAERAPRIILMFSIEEKIDEIRNFIQGFPGKLLKLSKEHLNLILHDFSLLIPILPQKPRGKQYMGLIILGFYR